MIFDDLPDKTKELSKELRFAKYKLGYSDEDYNNLYDAIEDNFDDLITQLYSETVQYFISLKGCTEDGDPLVDEVTFDEDELIGLIIDEVIRNYVKNKN